MTRSSVSYMGILYGSPPAPYHNGADMEQEGGVDAGALAALAGAPAAAAPDGPGGHDKGSLCRDCV
jgi:hypothetical protein